MASAVAFAHCLVYLGQGRSAQRLALNFQLGHARITELLTQVRLNSVPVQRGGAVFQGMQCGGHFLWQEVFAKQRHHLADLDHRALKLAEFVHQVLRLARQDLLALLLALLLAGKEGACGQGGVTGTGQEPGGGHRQSTLEGACFYALDRFSHG